MTPAEDKSGPVHPIWDSWGPAACGYKNAGHKLHGRKGPPDALPALGRHGDDVARTCLQILESSAVFMRNLQFNIMHTKNMVHHLKNKVKI